MEERSRFVQKVMFGDYLLIVSLAFVSLLFGNDGISEILRNFTLAEIVIGIVLMWYITFQKEVSDIYHGSFYILFMGTLAVEICVYFDDMVIVHFLLLLMLLTVVCYRKFYLCKLMIAEMAVIYLIYFLILRRMGIGEEIEWVRMFIAGFGAIAGGFVLAGIIGIEEKNRRIIRENRRTSMDMLRLVQMKKEEAEHLADVKSVFLANMSHEIRTPINAMLGMNEMILRECKQQDVLEYAENIERAGQTLLSLINDILDISKIESGKVEITPEEYDIGMAMHDIENIIGVKAEEKGLELKFEVAEDIPGKLYGDELRIKQILINVLNNAVKYTKRGEIVFCLDWEKIGQDDILMKVLVSDTGIGMKEEELEHIFDAFQRLDMENNRNIEGSGLGMTITNRFLELMNGNIFIESEYGKGTRVRIEIPQQVVEWTAAYFEESQRENTKRRKYQVSFIAPEVRILAVDDNPMNLSVIRGLLKKTMMQVDLVQSGLEAIEAVQREYYDLILMDHMMPQMDGIETMRQIKRLVANKNPHAPIIVLTANATAGSEQRYLEEGFDNYLSKPVQAEKLEQMICFYLPKNMVERQRTLKEQEKEEWKNEALEKELLDYGLDMSGGLFYLDYNIEQYLETAEVFLRYSAQRKQRVRKLLEDGDIQGYTIEVHSLKSNGKILGSHELSQMAEKLEEQGLRGNIEYLTKEMDVLEAVWNRTEQGIRYLIEQTKREEAKIAEGVGMEESAFLEKKEQIAQLVRQYEEEEAVLELEKLQSQGLSKAQLNEVTRVRELLEEFSYEQALEHLTN